MAKGKYKNKQKHNVNKEFNFIFDQEFNNKVINEIKKYDNDGNVEEEYKRLVNSMRFNEQVFFKEYENTIANHIIARFFVSTLQFKLEDLKTRLYKSKKKILDNLGFNGKGIVNKINTNISLYPSPRSLDRLKHVNDEVNRLLVYKNINCNYEMAHSVEELIEKSFKNFELVSIQRTKKHSEHIKSETTVNLQGKVKIYDCDLEFLKNKTTIWMDEAETVDDFIVLFKKLSNIAETLKGF